MPATPAPGYVILYGAVKNAKGEPVIGSPIRIRLSPNNQVTKGSAIDRTDIQTVTDINGLFEVQLLARLKVTLLVSDANFVATGILPLGGRVSMERLSDYTA